MSKVWNPTATSKLPEPNVEVIAQTADGKIIFAFCNYEVWYDMQGATRQVVAWMRKPAPYVPAPAGAVPTVEDLLDMDLIAVRTDGWSGSFRRLYRDASNRHWFHDGNTKRRVSDIITHATPDAVANFQNLVAK